MFVLRTVMFSYLGVLMSTINITIDSKMEYTVLSNYFIDQYMADANDVQLKIYIYLLRMTGSRKGTSVSDMADFFNYSEKDVLRALRYWEKKQILQLTFDANKNLTGIHLLDLGTAKTDAYPGSTLVYQNDSANSTNDATSTSSDALTGTSYLQVVPASAENKVSAPEYTKPNYSMDELRSFRENDTISRILFVTEQYLKKPLSSGEMKTIIFFSDVLKFSEDLIDYLVQYCVDHNKKDMRYIEKVAINWAQAGVDTPKKAATYVHKYEKIVYDVMKALGKTSAPTDTEASYVTKWSNTFGYDFSVISVACERTVLATDKHRFAYADGILTNWNKAGVHHVSDIEALDFNKKKTAKPTGSSSTNRFNQFKQNDYDFDALEQELISN